MFVACVLWSNINAAGQASDLDHGGFICSIKRGTQMLIQWKTGWFAYLRGF